MSVLILSDQKTPLVKTLLNTHQGSVWSDGLMADTQQHHDMVFVVNNHNASSVKALRLAIALRAHNPELPIFVCSGIENSDDEISEIAHAVSTLGINGEENITLDQFNDIIGVQGDDANVNEQEQIKQTVNLRSSNHMTAFIYGN